MSEATHPRTFQGAIERSKAWSKVRLSKAEAFSLMAHFSTVHTSPPGNYSELITLWNGCFEIQRRIKQRFEKTDWSKADGYAILKLARSSHDVREGIKNFLPQGIAQRCRATDADKQLLWAWYWLNSGIKQKPEEPYCYFYPSTLYFMAEPFVFREMVGRRLEEPDEFCAGMIAYSRRTGDDQLPGAAEIIAEATNEIAGSLRKKLPRDIRGFLAERSNYGGESQLGELIEKTLFMGYRGTPEEIMAQALDAATTQPARRRPGLSIVTSTIRDIRDEQRKEIPSPIRMLLKEANEIKNRAKKNGRNLTAVEKERLEEIPDEILNINQKIDNAAMNSDLAIENVTPEDEVAASQTESRREEFERRYPDKWALIKAVYIDEVSQKELALRDGVSPSAVNQKLKAATTDLYEFLKE
jgi:hypothetical protein